MVRSVIQYYWVTKKKVDENSKKSLLTLEDFEKNLRAPRYSEAEHNTTCDSEFMLGSVHEVGRSIRSSLHWVGRIERIHLFMDNIAFLQISKNYP
jgi:hypothetical protein